MPPLRPEWRVLCLSIFKSVNTRDSNSCGEALAAFIQALPKPELHAHLEGSVTLEQYASVGATPGGWRPEAWKDDFVYPSFADFERFVLGYAEAWFASPERYGQTASALFEARRSENVRYLECSFAAIVCLGLGLPIDEVVDAIKDAAPKDLETRVFMGLHHDSYTRHTASALEKALEISGLDGIDLHGPEDYPVREWMLEYWPAARQAGKAAKAHASELGPAWHAREAVERLGVNRVEHGVRVIEDASVIQLLVERQVTLDVCPISNFKLRVSPSLEQHPIRALVDAGVRCTVSTDDPFVFGNRLADDYLALATKTGFAPEELRQLARNGFEAALLEAPARARLLAELEAVPAPVLAQR